jgi:hypothetical protein
VQSSRSIADFDLTALYEALDAQREARALTWQEVARQVSRRSDHAARRGVSASTITGIRTRGVVEGDGVLQMLLWLERTPESFVPGHPLSDNEATALPRPEPGQVLRWNARALHAALDTRRLERGLTWKQVASEIGGCAPASLTRLAKGGRVAVPAVMRIVCWLDRPAARFTHITPF